MGRLTAVLLEARSYIPSRCLNIGVFPVRITHHTRNQGDPKGNQGGLGGGCPGGPLGPGGQGGPPGGDVNNMWANFGNAMHLAIMEARNAGYSSKDPKLPPFWSKMPTTWLQFIESKFNLKEITDDGVKCNCVIPALDSSTAYKLQGILKRPDKNNRYGQIRTILIKMFDRTPEKKSLTFT